MFSKFIGGRNVIQLNNTILKNYKKNKWLPIVFHAKESNNSEEDLQKSWGTLHETIILLSKNKIPTSYALKYSAFNDYSKINNIVYKLLHQSNTKFVFIDAEYDHDIEIENKVFDKLIYRHNTSRLFKTYQMYRKDNLHRLQQDLSEYKNFGVKLVRGAYHEKKSKTMHQNIDKTHEAYNEALNIVVSHIKQGHNINLLLATHNQNSIDLAKGFINKNSNLREHIYFGQLLGMADETSNELVKEKYHVMKYVPYGTIYETFPYLLRRLYENKYLIKYFL